MPEFKVRWTRFYVPHKFRQSFDGTGVVEITAESEKEAEEIAKSKIYQGVNTRIEFSVIQKES